MAIAQVVTRGYGNGTFKGTIAFVVTRGYSLGVDVNLFDNADVATASTLSDNNVALSASNLVDNADTPTASTLTDAASGTSANLVDNDETPTAVTLVDDD